MKVDVLKQLLEQGPLTLEVAGDCMQPVLARGARLGVERGSWFLPGDLVVFSRAESDVVTHRFLGYLPGSRGVRLVTRADRADMVDAPITPNQVLGRVVHVYGYRHRPGLRRRARSAASWAAWVLGRLAQRLASRKSRRA